MAFSIKNPETDRLARQLARKTGESLTDAVTVAVRERLQRVSPKARKAVDRRIDELVKQVAAIPDADPRPMDELLGYDEFGLPEKW